MRTVKIGALAYTQFEEIRDALISTIPFALIGSPIFSKARNEGLFYFWDGDYIPPCMKPYALSPVQPTLLAAVETAVKPALVNPDGSQRIDLNKRKE
jgi:hypothetical protein